MKEIGKERKIAIAALIIAVLMLTVAFAAMSRTLKINGTAKVDSANWDIHFKSAEMISKKGDAREVQEPVISNDGIDLTLKVGLRKPKDEITYEAIIINEGDIDAEIESIEYPNLTEDQAKIIEFEATYDDGSEISKSQELAAKEEKTVKIVIRYKDITDESLLATEAYDIPLTFKINYVQKGFNTESTPEGGENGDSSGEGTIEVSASGSYVLVTDVAPNSHDVDVKLTSDTITDFSDVTVKRVGQNVANVDAMLGGTGSFAALEKNNNGTYTMIKNDKVRFFRYSETFIPANTPVCLSVNVTELSENNVHGMVVIFYNADKSLHTDRNFNVIGESVRFFTTDFDVAYIGLYLGVSEENGASATFKNLQVAIGTTEAVTYVPYDVQTITANADGTVDGITSTSPAMLIYTDSSDVEITSKYQKKKITFKYNLEGKSIVNFGDSIFGNRRPPNDISTYLANNTGATVYNVAFGGCRMGKHVGNWDDFSMYNLATAIANDDFSPQLDALNYSDRTSYAEEPLELLVNMDFNNVDIITIAYGTNDFTGKNKLDNSTNPYDTSTYGGALRYSIETIHSAYPNIEIVLCTPLYRFWMDENGNVLYDSDSNEISGYKLTDFVNLAKEIANEYNLFVIDNYYGSGINASNRTEYFPSNDGTHPNVAGNQMIAEYMAKELYNEFK